MTAAAQEPRRYWLPLDAMPEDMRADYPGCGLTVVSASEADAYHASIVEKLREQIAELTARVEAAEKRWESAERWRLHMTGLQIQHIADFIDGDNETEVLVFYAEERKDAETGEPMPAGLYVSLVEYPDEGCVYLPADADAARAAQESRSE